MKRQVSSFAPWKRIRKDTLALLCTAFLSAALAVRFEAFESLMRLAETYERWELDELFSVMLISGTFAIIISFRRGRSLVAEIVRREASEDQAITQARHDALTGLPNRRVLADHFVAAKERAHRAGREVAVLLIDLDRFKPVNDIHGHVAGDIVLNVIGKRFQRLVEATRGAMLARLGGDEFALVLEYDPGSDKPVRLAGQIVQLAGESIPVAAGSVSVGASVGIAHCKGLEADADELLRQADVAMYHAKRHGRATFRSFEDAMDADLRLRSQLEAELRQAIPAGEIVPFYQPILSVPGREIVGFESLARWIHPVRGLLPPDNFISIAEDAGLIDELTFALLRRACADAQAWPASVKLSINISPVQLANPQLPAQILQAVHEGGLAPERLIVEITESGIVADLDAARHIMTELKKAGVNIALDDFGTGYSSLSHLHDLQFDCVKIDRSFIKRMAGSGNEELVKAIIGMGHGLGMRVTAEGVETEGNLSALAHLKCNHVQGFLFGAPSTAADALKLLALPRRAVGKLRLVA